jgi:hypothetical protein
MYENDEIDQIYYSDPEGATGRVIAAAASAAAAEVAMFNDSRRDAELERVRQGQAESAALTAIGEMESKYGADEWNRLQPRVEERLAQSPHLISDDARTSPTALAHQLEDLYKLVRGEAAEADERDTWKRIKGQGKNLFLSNGPLGDRGDA